MKDTGLTARRLVFLYVSSVLGAGILVVPGLTVQHAGSAAVALWVVLGIACIAIAALFADVSTHFPRASGIQEVVEAGTGRPLAIYSDVVLLVVYLVGNPAMGLASASYLAMITGAAALTTAPVQAAVGAGFMVVSVLASMLPTRVIGAVQAWSMRVAVVVILLASALALPRLEWENVTARDFPGTAGLVTAAGIAFYAYLGWENVSLLAGRVDDPQRAFRYAIRRAVPVVVVVYFVAAITFAALPPGGPALLVPALTAALPDAVRVPLVAVSLVAIVAATNAWVLGGASLFQHAATRLSPGWSTRDPRGLVPRGVLTVGYLVVLAGAGAGAFSMDHLLGWTSCLFLTVYGLAAYAFTRVRRRLTLAAATVLLLAAVMLLLERPVGLVLAIVTVIAVIAERYRHARTLHPDHPGRPDDRPERVRDDVPTRLPR
ncbi:APC family permease [Cellulomonas dongxiuzhuiae]|uniref:APC family permease n=1 Tax=Cellulomonas dongxiuzhuiae TaxID=2819979 RepID=UPI001AAE9243|nr:APC family permease [Cellulomonas dongxiuzhuiae]MBO3089158.1 APC family permease [Cellulomonas dongxiuzhuiae]